ncbi:hypothetical protein Q8A73_022476 [Channa argus]|nr:hypothetical protein Q8A73_022476 [Channa argus]
MEYNWESFSQTSRWLSPSCLRSPELGSHYDLRDTQTNIEQGGSTRSLQLDYRVLGYSSDRGRERGWESSRRTFHWERNQSGEWERKGILDRKEKTRHDGEGKNTGNRSRDIGVHKDHGDLQPLHSQDSCEDSNSPVYEEYRECSHNPEQNEESGSLYDTLPPTRRAYEGYPLSPPGLDLHPAQLLPPHGLGLTARGVEGITGGSWGGSAPVV